MAVMVPNAHSVPLHPKYLILQVLRNVKVIKKMNGAAHSLWLILI